MYSPLLSGFHFNKVQLSRAPSVPVATNSLLSTGYMPVVHSAWTTITKRTWVAKTTYFSHWIESMYLTTELAGCISRGHCLVSIQKLVSPLDRARQCRAATADDTLFSPLLIHQIQFMMIPSLEQQHPWDRLDYWQSKLRNHRGETFYWHTDPYWQQHLLFSLCLPWMFLSTFPSHLLGVCIRYWWIFVFEGAIPVYKMKVHV